MYRDKNSYRYPKGGGGERERERGVTARILVGVCDGSLRNMTNSYNPERINLRPTFIILVKFSTQICIFKPENHKL